MTDTFTGEHEKERIVEGGYEPSEAAQSFGRIIREGQHISGLPPEELLAVYADLLARVLVVYSPNKKSLHENIASTHTAISDCCDRNWPGQLEMRKEAMIKQAAAAVKS